MGDREFPVGSDAGPFANSVGTVFRTGNTDRRRCAMTPPTASSANENMQQRIEQFAGQVVTDLAAAMAGVMTNLGHKLGLYRAMAESGSLSSYELASRTGTNERSVREWLNAQAAGGYVLFDATTRQYSLPP